MNCNDRVINKKIIRNDLWFEGIDDISYKIDKLTGDIANGYWQFLLTIYELFI